MAKSEINIPKREIKLKISNKYGNILKGVEGRIYEDEKRTKIKYLLDSRIEEGVYIFTVPEGSQEVFLVSPGFSTKSFVIVEGLDVYEQEMEESTTVFVFNENGDPLQGATVEFTYQEEVKSATQINTPEGIKGKYAFDEVLSKGRLQCSLEAYIPQKRNIVEGIKQYNIRLLLATPENEKIQEVLDEYEEISDRVSGNSADNETVNTECSIPLPPVDEKIEIREKKILKGSNLKS